MRSALNKLRLTIESQRISRMRFDTFHSTLSASSRYWRSIANGFKARGAIFGFLLQDVGLRPIKFPHPDLFGHWHVAIKTDINDPYKSRFSN